MAEIVWLRRDLRRSDLPTLGAATALGGEVAIVFVLDPDGWAALGAPKRTFTARTLLATTARSASSTVARVMVTSTTCVASTIWITARLRPLRL